MGNVTLADVTVVTSSDGLGLEFMIPDKYFTAAIGGLTYNTGQTFPTSGDQVSLCLSQSFGYSVAGGSPCKTSPIAKLALVGSAAPEPAAWSLMILGFLGTGAALRSNRRKAVIA